MASFRCVNLSQERAFGAPVIFGTECKTEAKNLFRLAAVNGVIFAGFRIEMNQKKYKAKRKGKA